MLRWLPLLLLTVSGVGVAQPLLRLPDNREGWPFGICAHKNTQLNGVVTQALDDLDAPWVRIDVKWFEIEKSKGVFDWTTVDAMINNARTHGYLVFATLAYTPAWATSGPERSGVPSTPQLYGDFVSAVVARHKDKVKHWGLWNEPEQSHFWSGTVPEFFDRVLKPGYQAVKAADPQALVLGPDCGPRPALTASPKPDARSR